MWKIDLKLNSYFLTINYTKRQMVWANIPNQILRRQCLILYKISSLTYCHRNLFLKPALSKINIKGIKMIIDLYNFIYKNEKIIGINILKLTEDKASRRANTIAVKTTWKHYNLLKRITKWDTHLIKKILNQNYLSFLFCIISYLMHPKKIRRVFCRDGKLATVFSRSFFHKFY